MLSLSIFWGTFALAQSQVNSRIMEKPKALTISLTGFKVDEKMLKLSYEIKNNLEDDVWILAGIGISNVDALVMIDRDNQTLVIEQKLDVPTHAFTEMFSGRYIRLRAGRIQAESVSLTLPVHPNHWLDTRRQSQNIEYATQLVVKIGYYIGNLPGMIYDILEKTEKQNNGENIDDSSQLIEAYSGGQLFFNEENEDLMFRSDEIIIPYTHQALPAEEILRLNIDGTQIPYEGKQDRSERHPPDLSLCTRIEIKFQPSILEFFFPYGGQRDLISSTELEYLRAMQPIVLEGSQDLKAFAHNVSEGIHATGVVRQKSIAHIACTHDDKHLISFRIYNNESIVMKSGDRFIYPNGFPSLRMLSPQVQSIYLRVCCANNMRNLWHRLRLYHKAARKNIMLYPEAIEWCDTMLRVFLNTGMSYDSIIKSHICTSAYESKSHYAMNSNCKYNSPPDMVLLFETKADWNQHGGPELFTFDNHDPKGGCVLLNDGTVKFIRTKEELMQLRWK